MKQVIVVVKPYLVEQVLDALKHAPLEACNVREVKGYGRQKSYLDEYGDSEFSLAYLLAAVALNVVLALRVIGLWTQVQSGQHVDRQHALPLYKYSMLYLALLFLSMAIDRALFV